MADHRHAHPMWTTTLGNVGRITTNNFHHGNTAQNISPDTKTAIGKRWHRCKEKEWWDSQTIIPTCSSRRPNQELHAWQYLARSDSDMAIVPHAFVHQHTSHTSTSPVFQHREDGSHLESNSNTLGTSRSFHPTTQHATVRLDTTPTLDPYTLRTRTPTQADWSDPTLGDTATTTNSKHPTSQTRHHSRDTDNDHRVGRCHTALVHDITRSLQVSISTATHDHTDPSTTPSTHHHTIPSRRHTVTGIDHRILTYRTAATRTQLESPHRQQIYRDTIQNRTTYLQSTIHLEETTTGSYRHTLAVDGRRNCQRSTNG